MHDERQWRDDERILSASQRQGHRSQ